jgi:hypothetical protein
MKSQRYRTTNNKFWKSYNKKMSWAYYKRGKKYQERMLSSGFFEGQTYGALHKCWIGFVIAKDKLEMDKSEIHAKRIQHLEKDLGIDITDFSDCGIE